MLAYKRTLRFIEPKNHIFAGGLTDEEQIPALHSGKGRPSIERTPLLVFSLAARRNSEYIYLFLF